MLCMECTCLIGTLRDRQELVCRRVIGRQKGAYVLLMWTFTFLSVYPQHIARRCMSKKGTFSQPFLCPECCRSQSNMLDHLITSASSWSSHVEKVHVRRAWGLVGE